MTGDRGSITVWILGLLMVVLAIGGLVLDLWRVLDEKHRVEVIADAATAAGSAVIDESHYRATGDVVLDAVEARRRAAAVIAASGPVESVVVDVGSNRITVVLGHGVDLSLLKLLLPGEGRIVVRGRASGVPALHP